MFLPQKWKNKEVLSPNIAVVYWTNSESWLVKQRADDASIITFTAPAGPHGNTTDGNFLWTGESQIYVGN